MVRAVAPAQRLDAGRHLRVGEVEKVGGESVSDPVRDRTPAVRVVRTGEDASATVVEGDRPARWWWVEPEHHILHFKALVA